jgi:predicted histone-like DNA-binding protein
MFPHKQIKRKEQMSIYYRMDKQTDNLNSEESKRKILYPRIISKGTTSLSQLCRKAATGTSFSYFEAEGIARLLIDGIIKELAEGNNVCLDDFGTFSLSAEAVRTAQDEHEIRSESIRVKKIVFRTSRKLLTERSGDFKFQRKPKTEKKPLSTDIEIRENEEYQ